MLKRLTTGLIISLILSISLATEAYCETKSTKTFIGPTRGSISSLFGWRSDPFSKKTAFHCGLDVAAKSGTPIYALQEGYVVYSDIKGGYGKAVIIRHQYPDIPELPIVETMYAHNSDNLVKVGQYVRRGDIIAQVGSTGRSTGPHLHFEVHYNGGYVNPIDYLQKLPKYLKYVAYKRSKYYAYKPINAPQIKPAITAQQKSNYIMIED
ncbi:MAG: M23 family metallopeptidase [Cyanobacteriota bacterium]